MYRACLADAVAARAGEILAAPPTRQGSPRPGPRPLPQGTRDTSPSDVSPP